MKESTICVPSAGTKAQTTTTVETQDSSANIATNAMLAAVLNCSPVFYCQHKAAMWNCPHYKVVDKDFYSIETRCKYLGIDDAACQNKDCNKEACLSVLNGS